MNHNSNSAVFQFFINKELYTCYFVNRNDARLDGANDGLTDYYNHEIYIADDMDSQTKKKVLIHEICHTLIRASKFETILMQKMKSISEFELFIDCLADISEDFAQTVNGLKNIFTNTEKQ